MRADNSSSKGARVPIFMSVVVALALLAGSLQTIPPSTSSHRLNAALSSYTLYNPYSNGELWGGGSSAEKCLDCTATAILQADTAQSIQPGQHVSPITGDFTTSDSLFSVPGIYTDLGVAITYDAQRAATNKADGGYGPFGWDWQSPFDATLTFVSGTVTENEANGAQANFTPASQDGCPIGDIQDYRHYTISSGSWNSTVPYCAADRVDEQLGVSTYGTYETLQGGGTDPGSVQSYSNLGQLLYQGDDENPFGAVYSYSVLPGASGCPVGTQRCDVISDGTRATVAQLTAGTGLISAVIDPGGNVYQIAYDGDANVSSVTDPNGHVTSWGYSTGQSNANYQHELTSITQTPAAGDPNTETVTYTNDMVTGTTDAVGTNPPTSYSYYLTDCGTLTSGTPPALPTDCVDSPVANPQKATVTYPDSEIDTDYYVNSQLTSNCFGAGGSGPCWSFNYGGTGGSGGQNMWTPLTVLGPNGSQSVIEYDESWNVVQFTDANNQTSNFMYNDNGYRNLDELCWSADPTVAGFTPGGNNDTYTCSHAPTGATTYVYDANGNVLSKTDPLGNTTRYGYYTDGLLCWEAEPTVTGAGSPCTGTIVTSDPPVGSTFYAYDAYGNVSSKYVDYEGSQQGITDNAYNMLDQLKATIPPDGYTAGPFGLNAYETDHSYYANGQLHSTTGPNVSTSYTYDGAGNQTVETDLAGVTSTGYDADQRPCWSLRSTSSYTSTSCTRPSGASGTTYLADTSAPKTTTDENANTTTYTYSNTTFPTSPTVVTDPMTVAPVFNVYDSVGDLCLTGPSTGSNPTTCPTSPGATPLGDSSKFYDTEGQLTSSVDDAGVATTYTYTNVAFPMQPTQVSASYQTQSFTYDKDGNEVSQTLASGATPVISTGYDADGRRCWTVAGTSIVTATCSSPPTGSSWFTYDGAGNLYTDIDNYATTNTPSEARTYDASGNLSGVVNYQGSHVQGVSYQYTPANEVSCLAETNTVTTTDSCTGSGHTNTVIHEYYNAAGQMTSTLDWLGNTITYGSYNARSEVGLITYPSASGESVSYGYYPAGQVDSVNYLGTGLSGSDVYTLNADDQVGTSTQVGGANSPSDVYNNYKEVSQASNPGSTLPHTYGYSYGTITSDAVSGASTITYTPNAAEQITQISNPNVPSTPDTTLAYNANGQRCWSDTASAFSSSVCGSAPMGSTSYQWNAYGQLCWSGVTTSTASCGSTPSGATGYIYNGNGYRMSATTGSATSYFEWDMIQGGQVPQLIDDGTNAFVYGPPSPNGTAPIEQINLASNTASFLSSTLSGVEAVFSGTGSLLEEAAYGTYGTQTIQHGTNVTPFAFQGAYRDPSGLLFMINRYYDPATDQFLSVDPLVAQTRQPYAFTGDDPLNATDPLGLVFGSGSLDRCPASGCNSGGSKGKGLAIGAAAVAGASRAERSVMKNSQGWPKGDAARAIESYVGLESAQVDNGDSGSKVSVVGMDGTWQVSVLIDPGGGYYRVERRIAGLSPEYLMSNGTWIPQEDIDVASKAAQGVFLRESHFYNVGYTPSTVEAAQQWIAELRGSIRLPVDPIGSFGGEDEVLGISDDL